MFIFLLKEVQPPITLSRPTKGVRDDKLVASHFWGFSLKRTLDPTRLASDV